VRPVASLRRQRIDDGARLGVRERLDSVLARLAGNEPEQLIARDAFTTGDAVNRRELLRRELAR
jgi:hypothetical protein